MRMRKNGVLCVHTYNYRIISMMIILTHMKLFSYLVCVFLSLSSRIHKHIYTYNDTDKRACAQSYFLQRPCFATWSHVLTLITVTKQTSMPCASTTARQDFQLNEDERTANETCKKWRRMENESKGGEKKISDDLLIQARTFRFAILCISTFHGCFNRCTYISTNARPSCENRLTRNMFASQKSYHVTPTHFAYT